MGGALLLELAGLLLGERLRPLRKNTRSRGERWPRNLALGAVAGAMSAVTASAAAYALARRYRGGLVRKLPPSLRQPAAIALLDASYYLWHRANHEVPALWRFHRLHHVDPDLDLSTAVRFHPAEILLSTVFRVAQVLAVGPAPETLRAWDGLFGAAVLFHHANLRVPGDRWIRLAVVTPSFHGIHHDIDHLTTNYGSVSTVWDRLLGTAVTGIPQDRLTMGAR